MILAALAVIVSTILIGLIFVNGQLGNSLSKNTDITTNIQTSKRTFGPSNEEGGYRVQAVSDSSTTVANVPEEELQQHGTMPMEQFAERVGTTGEVLHDAKMMLAVNGYNVTDTLVTTTSDGTYSTIASEAGNKFLTVDLTVRSIGHSLPLSPGLFRLARADSAQEISTSSYTPLVDAGMKRFSLPTGQAARMLLVFEAPSFTNNSILKYSDLTSTFEITLSAEQVRPIILASESEPRYTTGEVMQDESLQLRIDNITSTQMGNDTANLVSGTAGINKEALKISLTFQNIGNSTVRIDPSYVFIQDNKTLYLYGTHTSLYGVPLPSSLNVTDLEPDESIAGDIIISLPTDSSDLLFMYASPNNTFIAKVTTRV